MCVSECVCVCVCVRVHGLQDIDLKLSSCSLSLSAFLLPPVKPSDGGAVCVAGGWGQAGGSVFY